jgi:molybdate transport system substrate-binding protein
VGDITNEGVDVVGTLPRSISTPTDFAAYISTRAKDSAAARALLDYLTSPAAAEVYRAAKMEPER